MADWVCGRWYEPQLRVEWPLEDAVEIASDGTGVTLEQWVQLAETFVAKLRDDDVMWA